MGRYDHLKVIVPVKARVQQVCDCCGKIIPAGTIYYREKLKNPLIKYFVRRFCPECFFARHPDQYPNQMKLDEVIDSMRGNQR